MPENPWVRVPRSRLAVVVSTLVVVVLWVKTVAARADNPKTCRSMAQKRKEKARRNERW